MTLNAVIALILVFSRKATDFQANYQSCIKYSTNKYQYQYQYQWSKYQYKYKYQWSKYQYLTFKYQYQYQYCA